jgi:hypothetical protein
MATFEAGVAELLRVKAVEHAPLEMKASRLTAVTAAAIIVSVVAGYVKGVIKMMLRSETLIGTFVSFASASVFAAETAAAPTGLSLPSLAAPFSRLPPFPKTSRYLHGLHLHCGRSH